MIRVERFDFGHYEYSNGQNVWKSHKAYGIGEISVKYAVVNYGRKPVKKYAVYFKAYNGANEIVNCTIRRSRSSIVGIDDADRLEPNVLRTGLLENAWVNKSIRRVEIDHIDVVYTDDTTESCIGNYILTPEDHKALQEAHRKKNTKQNKSSKQLAKEKAEKEKEEAEKAEKAKEEAERAKKKAEMEKERLNKAMKTYLIVYIVCILLILLLANLPALIMKLL